MSKESVDLVDTIKDIQENFQEGDYSDVPIVHIQNDLRKIDEVLVKVLNAPKHLSNKSIFRTNNRLQSQVFVDVQNVRQFRENLKSDAVPTELYYYLLDIKDDFDISDPVVFRPRREIAIREVADYFQDKFEKSSFDLTEDGSKFYEEWVGELRKHECHVIGFPISEMDNPMNFAVITHESLHAAKSPDSTDRALWEYICTEYVPEIYDKFDNNHLEEVISDFVTLHYIGPVYALRMAQLPNKIGYGSPEGHVSLYDRMRYSLKYLESIEGSAEWWSKRLPQFEKIRRAVEDEVKATLAGEPGGKTDEKYYVRNFDDVKQGIDSYFEDEGIPKYTDELLNIKDYLGMPGAGDSKVKNKLNNYLIDEDQKKKTAIPLKPCLLLNLLVLYERQSISELRKPVLLSFKKWYVTRKSIHD